MMAGILPYNLLIIMDEKLCGLISILSPRIISLAQFGSQEPTKLDFLIFCNQSYVKYMIPLESQ